MTKVLDIQTGEVIEVWLGEVTITGNIAVAYIIDWGSSKFAELNLYKPEEGWKVYPD